VQTLENALVVAYLTGLIENASKTVWASSSMCSGPPMPPKAGVGFGKPGARPGKFYSFSPPPPRALVAIRNKSPQ
jgi:hypothetical protein